MSDIRFTCPVCGQHFEADASMANQQLACVSCGKQIIVPAPPTLPTKPAGACAAPAPPRHHSVFTSLKIMAFSAQLKSKDWTTRQAAARALGRLGDARAVEPLIQALGDSYRDVRNEAAGALIQLGTAAVEPLIKALGRGSAEAAEALGALADDRAVDPLIQGLRWSSVCREAAVALGKIGAPRAVEPLIEVLRDGETEFRRVAAQTLGKLHDSRAVMPLIKASGDEDADVRRIAAEALGELNEPKWKEWVKGEPLDLSRLGSSQDLRALQPLTQALRYKDLAVRLSAVQALGELGDTGAVVPLINVLKDQSYGLRLSAVQALGELGDTGAVVPLINVLKDQSYGLRLAAAVALAKLRDARAVEPFIALLKDTWSQTRQVAVVALGELGDRRALVPIVGLIADPEAKTRQSAAEAMARLGEPKWRQWVHGDGEDFARLGESGEPLAVEALIRALSSGGVVAAAEALGKSNHPRAIEALNAALVHTKSTIRESALAVLQKLGRVDQLSALTGRVLYEYNEDAARSLAQSDDPRAVSAMIQAIQVRGETVGAYQLGWAGRWCEVRRIAVERLVQLCAAGKLSPDTVSQLRPLADAIARPHDDHNDATKAPNYTSDCYSHRDNGGVGIRLPLNAPTRDF